MTGQHMGNAGGPLGREIGSIEEYRALWKELPRLRITCVEKNEECKHAVGDSFAYENPYKKPDGVCAALLHVLDLYVWRATLGFPSWNESDFSAYRVHCPDPKGTVWELRRIGPDGEGDE